MASNIRFIKLTVLILFTIGSIAAIATTTLFRTEASSGGAPTARTGAPGESTCTSCHSANAGSGQLNIVVPASYVPGTTYSIAVTETTADLSRVSWGYEVIPLTAASAMAGTVALVDTNSRIRVSGTKSYVTQTVAGTRVGQTSSVTWTFNWTAPATDVGNVTFYAAGLMADDSGDTSGDQTYTKTAVVPALTTAALVDISGRVWTPEFRGLTNAVVTITGTDGTTRSTVTSRSGLYRFTDVEVGSTYVITALSRRYQFDAKVLQVTDDVVNFDLIAQPMNLQR